jgi:outer membrane protein OmpA-like peptidoglycan-associated protein
MTSYALCLAIAFCLMCSLACAQQSDSASLHWLIGPTEGFRLGFDAAHIPVYGTSADCGEFTSGWFYAPSAGVSLLMPSLFSDRLGLFATLGFSYGLGRLTVDPIEPSRIFDETTGELIQLDEEYRLASRMSTAYIDLLARYRFDNRLVISLGTSVGYRTAVGFSQTDYVYGPGDYTFDNGQRDRPITGGPQLQTVRLSYGPVAHFGYEAPLGRHTLLIPALTFRAEVGSPVTDFSWTRFSGGLDLSIMFDVHEAPIDIHPEDLDSLNQRKPALFASLELYGVDEEDHRLPAAQISVYETFYQQNVPLLPAVFFSALSSDLPERYVTLTPSTVDSFTIDRLANLSMLDIQHQTLNILGWRLRGNLGANLTLGGSVSRDEPPELARTRAATVSEYLGDVWGIDTARIRVSDTAGFMQRSTEATEDGRADNRRVEFASNAPDVTAPVVIEQVVRDFDPPIIKLNPIIRAEAGVRRWDLVITQDRKEVARYSSDTNVAGSDLTWEIVRERIDSGLAPLIAELTVEDSTGAITHAVAQAPLVLVKRPRVVNTRIERSGDRERIAYDLVGFDFRSADVKGRNSAVVRDVSRMVHEGARVTITGYTDRIGTPKLNAELAAQRAEKVAAALRATLKLRGVQDVTIRSIGAGEKSERFSNDLPEGRMLSRGVGIVVEQTVEDGHP